ncbi:hypothetical protein [Kitasatospora sp. NPDC057015]|uniref:hypothetical protein n=1 Tax=Kitasatospora sp. NPDC057015 TaxID=3346001 RepID=UPI003629BF9A
MTHGDPDGQPGLGVEVAVKLEHIRGIMETGFARLNGRLDVVSTRIAQLEDEVATLREEMEAVQRSRWPLPSLAALTGIGALVLSVVVYLRR